MTKIFATATATCIRTLRDAREPHGYAEKKFLKLAREAITQANALDAIHATGNQHSPRESDALLRQSRRTATAVLKLWASLNEQSLDWQSLPLYDEALACRSSEAQQIADMQLGVLNGLREATQQQPEHWYVPRATYNAIDTAQRIMPCVMSDYYASFAIQQDAGIAM